MGPLLRIPLVRTLHERQLLFPVVVVLVVSGVLVQGALQRGGPVEASDQEAVPVPLPPRAARRPDLDKTPLVYDEDYWGQLRERVEDKIVLVGPDAIPAVVVMPGFALTSAEAGEAVLTEIERARLVEPDDAAGDGTADPTVEVAVPDDGTAGEEPGQSAPLEAPADPTPGQVVRPGGLIAVDRDRGLAIFEVDASRIEAFELIPPAAVPSGSYVGAVTRDRSGRAAITPGHLVSVRAEAGPEGHSLVVSMPLAGPGATAVTNLDGALVGVAVGTGGAGPRLLSSSAVRREVAELQRLARCRALLVSELDPSVLALLGLDTGLLVEEVREDAFVPEPSLRAGDVILDWDGEAVTTVEAFEHRSDSLDPGAIVRYRVLRGRRRLAGGTILPGADCRPLGEPPVRLLRYGLALRWTAAGGVGAGDGWRVAATAPGGLAAAAGLLPDDLVLAIDGRPADDLAARAVFERLEQRGAPTVLTVRRADRVRMLALAPGESGAS